MTAFISMQIIPAPHWFAIIETSPHESERVPLVCWALDSDGDICGMIAVEDGKVIPAISLDAFAGYELEVQEYDIDMELLN